ncbi:MAG: (d)CMP kinase [Eubacteriales bacterium]|nr:(d)CMP kinase [Eubacteriales bacterium]MDD3073112.1 (d)CMP kinase [Eubacteriales bacterium]MDD4078282.1 (d)CMP kinase [Eubacteriales bacterium]MDD4768228.1 (d)CMP kinase [Eubacteriales bacterium]
MGDTVSIVFDGPAGVGKSTIAKALARKLGYTYVDTGAMYRAVTLFALEQGVPIDAEHQQEMLALIETADFEFIFVDGGLRIFYGPRDLTEDIRSREVTGMVSHAAALPEVRRGMCALQRQMANSSNVVMEGRDIGTVVLPMATYKFFLTASAEVRAMRRYQELMVKGIEIDFATVLKEITERDRLDSSRKYAPLCKADDAIELDTSGLDAEEVLSLVLSIIK